MGDVFEPERIVGVRRSRDGAQLLYRIRWRGFSARHDSWEPFENFLAGGEQLLENYRAACRKKGRRVDAAAAAVDRRAKRLRAAADDEAAEAAAAAAAAAAADDDEGEAQEADEVDEAAHVPELLLHGGADTTLQLDLASPLEPLCAVPARVLERADAAAAVAVAAPPLQAMPVACARVVDSVALPALTRDFVSPLQQLQQQEEQLLLSREDQPPPAALAAGLLPPDSCEQLPWSAGTSVAAPEDALRAEPLPPSPSQSSARLLLPHLSGSDDGLAAVLLARFDGGGGALGASAAHHRAASPPPLPASPVSPSRDSPDSMCSAPALPDAPAWMAVAGMGVVERMIAAAERAAATDDGVAEGPCGFLTPEAGAGVRGGRRARSAAAAAAGLDREPLLLLGADDFDGLRTPQ